MFYEGPNYGYHYVNLRDPQPDVCLNNEENAKQKLLFWEAKKMTNGIQSFIEGASI